MNTINPMSNANDKVNALLWLYPAADRFAVMDSDREKIDLSIYIQTGKYISWCYVYDFNFLF